MININLLITDGEDEQLVNETVNDFESARKLLEEIEYEYDQKMDARTDL